MPYDATGEFLFPSMPAPDLDCVFPLSRQQDALLHALKELNTVCVMCALNEKLTFRKLTC